MDYGFLNAELIGPFITSVDQINWMNRRDKGTADDKGAIFNWSGCGRDEHQDGDRHSGWSDP